MTNRIGPISTIAGGPPSRNFYFPQHPRRIGPSLDEVKATAHLKYCEVAISETDRNEFLSRSLFRDSGYTSADLNSQRMVGRNCSSRNCAESPGSGSVLSSPRKVAISKFLSSGTKP